MNDKTGIPASWRRPFSSWWKLAVLCLVSAAGNLLLNWSMSIVQLPLFLDTVFTAAVTFCAGFWAGIGTLALYQFMFIFCAVFLRIIPLDTVLSWACYLPCAVLEIFLVSAFRARNSRADSLFPREKSADSFILIAVPLMLLAALDCLTISAAGGITDWILFLVSFRQEGYMQRFSVDIIKLGLIRNNLPFLAAAILARIPINIVDRFIVVFGGFGLSLLYRKWRNN